MIRRFLFQVHMWIGLLLGVLFVALGLSGSLLVYAAQINRLTAPLPRASLGGTMQPLDRLIAAATPVAGRSAVLIELPGRAGEPAVVRFPPDPRAIFVDPVTAMVLGSRLSVMSPVIRYADEFHGSLFAGGGGRLAVGWLGIAMTTLGITGLVVWWPKGRQWRAAFVVRRAATGLRFYRELHGAAGIWGFAVFIVVSITGPGMVFSDAIWSFLSGGAATAFSVSAVPSIAAAGDIRGADVAARLARRALPSEQVVSVMLRPGRAISVAMSPDDDSPMLDLVYVDPSRAAVVGVADLATISAADRVIAWQKPLHTGMGAGPVWRLLIFLSGFLPLVFFATGATMWLKKRRNRQALNRAPVA